MTITPTTTEDFAARMDKLGITQSFLAEYIGISQSEVSKIVGGVRLQDSQRMKQIDDALRELESVATFFAPMKPAFEDVNAVKAWLSRPSLPHLFDVIANAEELRNATPQEFAIAQEMIRRSDEYCERLEAEIAKLQEQTRDAWQGFLREVSARVEASQ